MSSCARPFDETLLSGYLDHALPQSEAQKIRLHLEDCGLCRELYEDLLELREAARSTTFRDPEAWPELPKTRPSRFSRSLGWLLLTAWLVVVGGLALWRLVTASGGDAVALFLYLGLPGAFALLAFSVLLDRLRDLKTDRYRRIHR